MGTCSLSGSGQPRSRDCVGRIVVEIPRGPGVPIALDAAVGQVLDVPRVPVDALDVDVMEVGDGRRRLRQDERRADGQVRRC